MLGARMRGGRPQEAAQRLPDGRKAIEGPLWTAPEADGTPASPVGPSEATTLDRLRRSRAWHNLGDLKRDLIDLWIGKRNALTKEVMTGIEARRREAAQ